MAKFAHLHTHSHYSLLDGLAKIDELVETAKRHGMDALALTDHGVLYGAVEFYQKARAAGVKPVLGVEAYVAPKSRFDREYADRYYHLILLAENNAGWKNIVKLVTAAHLEGFYYKPRMDKTLLREHREGIIALSACLGGEVAQHCAAGNWDAAKYVAREYRDIFGAKNFFLEIQKHPHIAESEKVEPLLLRLSAETGIPLVATQDIHYVHPEDNVYHDVLLAVQTGNRLSDDDRLTLKADNFSLLPPDAMAEKFSFLPEAVARTTEIADRCRVELELGKTLLPHFPKPAGKGTNEYLQELIAERIGGRFPERNRTKEVAERVRYEVGVIEKTGFADYFLIVQDLINWAKSHGIAVGPGRGSAAGSIVSYILGITDLDPLQYGLLFERFLNPDRIQMPDIDIDFADRRRDEVIAYARQKYGTDRVAQIITFGTMAARAAVRDAGRAMGLPYGFCDSLAKLIPFNLTLKESLEKVPELLSLYHSNADAKRLIDTAEHLEGVARHASVHACGTVIAKDPLIERVPLQLAPQDKNQVITQFEMHAIEDLGLLKIDLLGLRNLTIIEEAVRLVREMEGTEIKMADIPLNDRQTFDLLRRADTTGVFQFECLSGDTIISNTTIKKLYEKRDRQLLESVYLDNGKVHKNKILDVVKSGKKEIYTLIAGNGWYIKATAEHSFLTPSGWEKLKNLRPGTKLLIKTKAKHLTYNTCAACGKQISGQKNGKSNFCHSCSARHYKNPSKPISRERFREARKRFFQNGGSTWNNGITTENNELWRRTAAKISRALRGKTWDDLHGTEKAAQFRKNFSEKFSGSGNPMFGKKCPHRKGGRRDDLGHYVRSTWEADFARILNYFNVRYEYEPQTFQLTKENGDVISYTPDFYVPSINTFYEIKGWLHDRDQEKIDLFIATHPEYNFILINKTKFAELAMRYQNIIAWECPKIPKRNFDFVAVKEIKYSGIEETYDIAMEPPGNNFVANGFVVHNSSGMRRYMKDIQPTELEDLIALVALFRPGPMELIPSFIARKHGREKITYLHPKLEPILKNTYGIGVYQEQMMQIARDLAGYTLAEADTLRKAIGKKIKALLDEQQEKLTSGMVRNGIDPKTARAIWELFPPFARYGFNKSHAACYALIGYQTAYLKAHYPVEFMAALLNAELSDIDRIAFLVAEAKQSHIRILPPDLNASFVTFTPEGAAIRFGLLGIKNVGGEITKNIIEERAARGPFKDFSDFLNRIHHKDLNKKSLESLAKSGVFDSLGIERAVILENMDEIIRYNSAVRKNGSENQNSLFGGSSFAPALKLKAAAPVPQATRLAWEKELLGFFLSDHPLNMFRSKISAVRPNSIKEVRATTNESQPLRVVGLVSQIKKIITKNGQPMCFATVEDLSGEAIEAVVFNSVLIKSAPAWEPNTVVYMEGRVSWRDDEPKFLCDRAQKMEA